MIKIIYPAVFQIIIENCIFYISRNKFKKINKSFFSISCFLGLFAVIFGAFGSHVLKNTLSEKMMEIYKTANLYHFFHSIMATFLCFQLKHFDSRLLKTSIFLFIIGIFIFSGSLYLLAVTGFSWLGAITPIGGIFFIFAWFLLFCFALKYNNIQKQ